MADESYSTIRDPNLLGPFMGARVLEITQHDPEEWEEDRQAYFCLHFDNGYTLKILIDDAPFVISPPGAILGQVHDADDDDESENTAPGPG